MKILFWILALLSIPVGLFMSVVSFASHGLGLACTVIGTIVNVVGMLSVVVSIVCMVLGIHNLRRENVKKAVVLALAGVAYSGLILAGMFIDETVDTILMKKANAQRDEQLYGENWDAPPAIEGIPASYQKVLNKFYAVVRDRWTADELMDLGAMTMPGYYGDASLDNIGFLLMDVNGDSIQELLIGTMAPTEGGTGIFCIYSNPENTNITLSTIENDIYYLHSGAADGKYLAEIGGEAAAWRLESREGENGVDINYQEGTMDPAGRLTLELIPFSRYK